MAVRKIEITLSVQKRGQEGFAWAFSFPRDEYLILADEHRRVSFQVDGDDLIIQLGEQGIKLNDSIATGNKTWATIASKWTGGVAPPVVKMRTQLMVDYDTVLRRIVIPRQQLPETMKFKRELPSGTSLLNQVKLGTKMSELSKAKVRLNELLEQNKDVEASIDPQTGMVRLTRIVQEEL